MKQRLSELQSTGPETTSEVDDDGDTDVVFARNRNAHALAKSRRPFSDFPWLCDLDEKKGLDIGPTYRNSRQAQVFMSYIAQHLCNELSERLKSTPFLSIICDGTQDQVFMEQEIVFVRSAKRGKTSVDFIRECGEGGRYRHLQRPARLHDQGRP
ncbi:hypothetical protein NP493_1988g00023 [Ridgeia piscesae]|uniref:DUF4371 domain-containing protein n=1 Tax=Ridgeia piscesae TaxID=27915 RepID=A0AAD9N4B2_RIDPI|nr:hypothetical protein NP493_1988g00023 [Ridgeia piscesae]